MRIQFEQARRQVNLQFYSQESNWFLVCSKSQPQILATAIQAPSHRWADKHVRTQWVCIPCNFAIYPERIACPVAVESEGLFCKSCTTASTHIPDDVKSAACAGGCADVFMLRDCSRRLNTAKAILTSHARFFGTASNLTAVRVGASPLRQLVAAGQKLQIRTAASSAAAIMAGDAAEAGPDSAAAESATASGNAPAEKAGAEVQVSPAAAGEDTQQAASGKAGTAAVEEAVDPVLACEQQLEKKITRIRELFPGFKLPELEIHRSAPHHYRLR